MKQCAKAKAAAMQMDIMSDDHDDDDDLPYDMEVMIPSIDRVLHST